MDFSNESTGQLISRLKDDFGIERKVGLRILFRLKEVRRRKLYAEMGYPSLFAMLIKYFKQSETAANQRIKALDLMFAVPAVEDGLASGELNLSTLAMAQKQINREEKITGSKVSSEKKAEIVEAITGKTMAQAEVELFKQLPETASLPPERERRISEDTSRWELNVPDDVREMMDRLKDLWGNVDPSMEKIEVIRRALRIALAQVDPIERKKRSESKAKPTAPKADAQTQCATESVKHRGNDRPTYYSKDLDAALWARANSQCEWRHPTTGERCDCTFGLQREHVIPIALGGTNELSNMQLLCRAHNELRARHVFGNKKINFHQQRGRSR